MAFRYLISFLEDSERPRGIAMWQRQGDRLDMLAWDWIDQIWREAPDLVAPMLVGENTWLAIEVARSEAEATAAYLGIAEVPTEDEAMSIVDANDRTRERSVDICEGLV